MDDFIKFKKVRVRKSGIMAYYPDSSVEASLGDESYVVLILHGSSHLIRVQATVSEVDDQIRGIK